LRAGWFFVEDENPETAGMTNEAPDLQTLMGRQNVMPKQNRKLPTRFGDLVRLVPPMAIRDDAYYTRVLLMIDRLMAEGKLTAGQELYLETLVQFVQAYETEHHAIDTTARPAHSRRPPLTRRRRCLRRSDRGS
jgi:hypothetical protein